MQARDKIFTLFAEYQQSYSAENKFSGDEKILNQIKETYALLSPEDQKLIQTQCETKCKEESILKPHHLIKSATGGAVGGAILGGAASLFSSQFPLFSTCFKGAITGGIVGGYGYLNTQASSVGETIPSLTRKMRSYVRLKEAVGLSNDLLAGLHKSQTVISEGAYAAIGEGEMRRRRGNG